MRERRCGPLQPARRIEWGSSRTMASTSTSRGVEPFFTYLEGGESDYVEAEVIHAMAMFWEGDGAEADWEPEPSLAFSDVASDSDGDSDIESVVEETGQPIVVIVVDDDMFNDNVARITQDDLGDDLPDGFFADEVRRLIMVC
jgi:hypothetical protein